MGVESEKRREERGERREESAACEAAGVEPRRQWLVVLVVLVDPVKVS